MQLAAGDGVVAGGAQTLAHGRRRHPVGDGGQGFAVALLVGLQAAEAVRQVSGEQAVARRHAHRIGRIGQFEAGAFARQPVQRQRAHVPVAGVSRQPVVLLIGGDQQDVRPRGRAPGCRMKQYAGVASVDAFPYHAAAGATSGRRGQLGSHVGEQEAALDAMGAVGHQSSSSAMTGALSEGRNSPI